MKAMEIIAGVLVAGGVVMGFTSSLGIGDVETAKFMIVTGVSLLGGYAYGMYRAAAKKIRELVK